MNSDRPVSLTPGARFEAFWETIQARGDDAESLGATRKPSPRGIADTVPVLSRIVGDRGVEPGPGAPDFTVTGFLAEGGMGTVHHAHQWSVGRPVALKVLRADQDSPDLAARLVAEARITGALEHPGIVPVHAVGTDSAGRPAVAMKRVSGVAWKDLLVDADHPRWADLPADRLRFHLDVLIQVCNTLHFAHSRRVVHRDVKPANVMVGDFGEVYLLDWGIALRLDAPAEEGDPTQWVGTPSYIAPEMLPSSGMPVGVRTDVYLLGATLHEVLTGGPLHPGPSLLAALLQASRSDPQPYPPSVPEELADLCRAATSRDPAHRPEDALAFRRALQDYLDHRGSAAVAEQADQRRREMEAAAARPEGEVDGPAIQRLFGECLFGYRQALAAWSGNRAARDGLRQCLVWMVERELARDAPDAAATWLAELPEPDPERAARVEAARQRRTARVAELERLRRVEAQLDLRSGRRARHTLGLWATTGTAAFACLLSWAARRGWVEPTPGGFAAVVGAATVVMGVVALARRPSSNRANRAMAGTLVIGSAGMTAVLASLAAFDFPLAPAVPLSMAVPATTAAVLALSIDARFWAAAATFTAGMFVAALVARLAPGYVLDTYAALLLVLHQAMNAAETRSEHRQPPPDDTAR